MKSKKEDEEEITIHSPSVEEMHDRRMGRGVAVEKVLEVIGGWWADQIHGSPIGRNVQAWNHLVKAMEDLRKRLEAM